MIYLVLIWDCLSFSLKSSPCSFFASSHFGNWTQAREQTGKNRELINACQADQAAETELHKHRQGEAAEVESQHNMQAL